MISPPSPEKDESAYTPERVRDGLGFAVRTLRNTERKLSPLGQKAIEIYKEACASYLDFEEQIEGEIADRAATKVLQQELVSQIRMYEQSIVYNGFMQTLDSTTAQELQDKILQLKRIEFYRWYGDHLQVVCKNLKLEAEKSKTQNWEHLSEKYWLVLDEKIQC